MMLYHPVNKLSRNPLSLMLSAAPQATFASLVSTRQSGSLIHISPVLSSLESGSVELRHPLSHHISSFPALPRLLGDTCVFAFFCSQLTASIVRIRARATLELVASCLPFHS